MDDFGVLERARRGRLNCPLHAVKRCRADLEHAVHVEDGEVVKIVVKLDDDLVAEVDC